MRNESTKVFFSYARADSEFVLQLAAELRSAGVDLWLDQLDIHAGDQWDRAIESALKTCSSIVVVLSTASTESHNVLDEIALALEQHKKIIPILYRPCEVPLRLRRLHYVDFTGAYKIAFEKLLIALNTFSPGTASPNLVREPITPSLSAQRIALGHQQSDQQPGPELRPPKADEVLFTCKAYKRWLLWVHTRCHFLVRPTGIEFIDNNDPKYRSRYRLKK